VVPFPKHVLVWKLEDGPAHTAGSSGSPDDVGPAWIETYSSDGTVTSERVANGEWITRREAHRLAAEGEFEVLIDDGSQPVPHGREVTPNLDLKAINRRLRSLGVTADQLTLRPMSHDVFVVGSLVQHLDPAYGPKGQGEFVFTTAGVSMSPDEALAAVGRLVPTWNSDGGVPSS
jgi:hypothetical protein